MTFTDQELEMLARMEDECIAAIEGTSWSDCALSPGDKHLIGMAVSWTYRKITERLEVTLEKPDAKGN